MPDLEHSPPMVRFRSEYAFKGDCNVRFSCYNFTFGHGASGRGGGGGGGGLVRNLVRY